MCTFNTVFLACLLVTPPIWSAEKRALTIEDLIQNTIHFKSSDLAGWKINFVRN